MFLFSADAHAPVSAGADTGETDPAALVAARFRRSGHPFLSRALCEFRSGLLILSGTVPTFHLKQLVQELAMHTPGVREVRNDMQVTGQLRQLERQPSS